MTASLIRQLVAVHGTLNSHSGAVAAESSQAGLSDKVALTGKTLKSLAGRVRSELGAEHKTLADCFERVGDDVQAKAVGLSSSASFGNEIATVSAAISALLDRGKFADVVASYH